VGFGDERGGTGRRAGIRTVGGTEGSGKIEVHVVVQDTSVRTSTTRVGKRVFYHETAYGGNNEKKNGKGKKKRWGRRGRGQTRDGATPTIGNGT